MTDGDAGRLVSSGRFRVDRSRALEKLMRFQLKDATMFALPWVQAAVAGGATRVDASVTPAGFELVFDGREWTPDELRDPYHHLFDADPDGTRARNRELAVGLLSALRLDPKGLTVRIRTGKREHALFVEGPTEEHLVEQEGSPLHDATTRYGGKPAIAFWVGRSGGFQRTLAHLESLCRRCPIPITLHKNGRQHKVFGRFEQPLLDRKRFASNGAAGEIGLSPDSLEGCSLDFIVRGVTVLAERVRTPGVPSAGYVRDDALRKSLSQIEIVKDGRYETALAAVRAESVALLKDCLRKTDSAMPPVGAMLADFDLRRQWLYWEGWSLTERFANLVEGEGGEEILRKQRLVRETSLRVAALRAACLHHRIAMRRGDRGVPALLWDAAILFDETGRPLTLRGLREQARWLTTIPFVKRRSAAPFATHRAAWILHEADLAFLKRFFKEDEVRSLSPLEISAPVKTDAVLDQENLLIKTEVRAGAVAGEIGLSVSPHPRQSRMQWFNQVRSIGRSRWDMRGLRMEAALYHPQISQVALPGKVEAPAAECLAAVAAAAPSLYERLAAEYRPEEQTPRQAMIREHLIDFLRSFWKPEPGAAAQYAWLTPLPLFLEAGGGYLSVRDLNRRGKEGGKPTLEPSVHPKKLRSLAIGYPDHVKLLFENSKLIAGIRREGPRTPAKPAPKRRPPPKLKPAEKIEPKREGELVLPPTLRRSDGDVVVDNLIVADPAREVRRWLKALKGRGACPLSEDSIETVAIDSGHKLLRLLSDRGNLMRLMPYAVSICFSDLNRKLRELTDAQDARFTLSLAELVLEADEKGEYRRVLKRD
jgi:hypothetical protein